MAEAEFPNCQWCERPLSRAPVGTKNKDLEIWLCANQPIPRGAEKPIPCDGDAFSLALKNHPDLAS